MPDLLSTTEAAARKGCTAMAIRNAIERGDLNASKLGHVWAVVDDATLAAYTVRETGGRAHRQRSGASRLGAEAGDVSADT